ncbi:GMP synthase-Glutamine amidotransferase [Salinihabitans flavidus]|uniref:GMP synthase-Glutamine amidotransferase n=1 Tax=Salinihabitans flavidus TaxID=569882 RepID=A0A1H8VDM3_9RHOB|nr:type 1 glutamine amidotransferase [Salinihabitans flavidus]SEP13451.1 GMP synthase-Glutamine amidotransferase [Salinihabitans flavidus]
MKVCILETDRPDDAKLAGHGTYVDMLEALLGPALPEARFDKIDVTAAALPEDPRRFDAYLITGARAGVYDDHPWISPLMAFLRKVAEARVPLFGVCFGHQVMAQAFGGEARKAECGWVLGRNTQTLTSDGEAIFGAGPLEVLSIHQDQVITKPPNSRRLVDNAASPNGALIYDDFPAMSVQFHPEFEREFFAKLLDMFAGSRLSVEQVESAKTGLDRPLDTERIARGIADFLRSRTLSPE